MPRKSSFTVLLLLLVLLLTASAGFPQPPSSGMLFGALIHQQARVRAADAQIQRITQGLQLSEARMSSALGIIVKARQVGNANAEKIARQAFDQAAAARHAYQTQLRMARRKAEQARRVKEKLDRALAAGSGDDDLQGLVERTSGDVSVHSAADGSVKPVADGQLGLLRPGDEVRTGPGSRAEMQVADGRGTVTMDGNSRFAVEKDAPDTQAVNVLAGRCHFAVQKADAFAAAMEQNLAAAKNTLKNSSHDPEKAYEHFLKKLRVKIAKKFEVRTPAVAVAVRGTEFLVTQRPDGGSTIAVIEGRVEVRGKGAKTSEMVNTGQSLSFSPQGVPDAIRQIDLKTLQHWWEEKP